MKLGITLLLSIFVAVPWLIADSWRTLMEHHNPKKYSVTERLDQYAARVRADFAENFAKLRINYPPSEIILIALKAEKQLEVWVPNDPKKFSFLKQYKILAASGSTGPKFREGDKQVPEGFYKVELLNPNSKFHLSLRLNYPNEFDREIARQEKRQNLGGDIMIHGSEFSVGCLAIGDSAIEEIFVLAHDVGIKNIQVIISPVDFRKSEDIGHIPGLPTWTHQLYAQIRQKLEEFEHNVHPF